MLLRGPRSRQQFSAAVDFAKANKLTIETCVCDAPDVRQSFKEAHISARFEVLLIGAEHRAEVIPMFDTRALSRLGVELVWVEQLRDNG